MDDLSKLQYTVDAFCSYIEALPPDELTEQAWGPKEVLAHLVQYHESFANQAEAIIAGTTAPAPEGRFIDVNANAVQASRGVPVVALVNRFRDADERLRAVAEAHDPTTINLLLKSDSVPRSLAGVITMVEHHIRSHHRQLVRGVKQESQSDKLQKALTKLTDYIAGLPPDQHAVLDTALHEMLAIAVFRHGSNLAQAEAVAAGQTPSPPQGRVTDLNSQAIKASQNIAQAELLQRLRSIVDQLCDLAHLHDPDQIAFTYRQDTNRRTLNDAIGQAETDLRRGLLKLRKSLR